MNEDIRAVKEFYDANSIQEWKRFDRHPYEFELTKRMLDRYIKPGDSVLDIGGGPGRYSIYYTQRGCEVTLLDLSEGNAAFARNKAKELGLSFEIVVGNALEADKLISRTYDHVLVMGPMYHLLEKEDRTAAIKSALKLLKPGGTLSASFITLFAGIIFYMRWIPCDISNPDEKEYQDKVLLNEDYSGGGFTRVHLAAQNSILPFFEQFPLEKLRFFGQEGILAPCKNTFMEQPSEVQTAWVDFAEKLCEREELLAYSEHLMYIGRKL